MRKQPPTAGHSEFELRNSKLERLRAYAALARPANVVTAWADVLAGFAAAIAWSSSGRGFTEAFDDPALWWLLLATTGLYAGGVVFNDVFDAALDAEERPERPIPSGRVSRAGAVVFGSLLLLAGIGAGWMVGPPAGGLATAIAVGALVYDRFAKHHAVLGPLNMGLCRGGNLLLGMSVVPAVWPTLGYLGLLPVVYIAAITWISRSEVHGGSGGEGRLAMGLVVAVVLVLVAVAVVAGASWPYAVPFVALFAWLVVPAFVRAARTATPADIQRAVRAGVIGLIPMNAALAAAFASWPAGLIVLGLLPVSVGLARLFAVT